MLSPDTRTVAVELLRPPPGYRLHQAVLTTYSLDLEALLALPLAVLAHSDGDIESLLADPLLIVEALRQAGERLTVFVDEGGIAIPGKALPLYSMLEQSVVPVRAPGGGVFHPKVWVASFLDEEDTPLIRVSVLSRNLTYDRSWDIALTSEAEPQGRRRHRVTAALAQLIRTLPELAGDGLPQAVLDRVTALAEQVAITRFPAPDGFDDFLGFEVLGLDGPTRQLWRPPTEGVRLLVISPFIRKTALERFGEMVGQERILVSRQEELDALPDGSLRDWKAHVLADAAHDEADDDAAARPSGLHAKAFVVEHGADVTWTVGSANLTVAATKGINVELVASITGRRGRLVESKGGQGINRFFEAGFEDLLVPYERIERETDPDTERAKEQMRRAERALLDAELRIACTPADEIWDVQLVGDLVLSEGVELEAWPLSLQEEDAKTPPLPLRWPSLPTPRLTAFLAFRLSSAVAGVDDIELVRKLPTEGFPEGRVSQVLRLLIDSPERLLQFLRALLGGLEGLAPDFGEGDGFGSAGNWGSGLGGETLLEDLVRMASREPSRLEPVRRLIEELRETEEGRKIVPDDLLAVWRAVDTAVGRSR